MKTKAEEEGHEFREISLVDLRNDLSEIVRRLEFVDDEVLITRNGNRVAALISMRAFKILQERVEELENEADRRELERGLES